jgi:hypothetical protein
MGYLFTDEQLPKAQYKFVDEQKPSIIDDFMMPTLKAIPPVVTHTAASMAQMPFAGLVASTIGLKTLYDTGNLDTSLNAANNVLEDSQQALNDAYLTTPQSKESAKAVSTKLYSPIGLFNKGIEMSGQGWGGIGKLTGIPYAEPTLNTMGQAAFMFGTLESGKAAQFRLGKDLGGLDNMDYSGKNAPYSITPGNAPRITPEFPRYQFTDDNPPTQLSEPQAPIVNRVGNPYRSAADAQSIMELKGLAGTHEVIPYGDGFALQRKGVQSWLQDLNDPMGLYKEPVPTQETPAPAKVQTAPVSQGEVTTPKNSDNNLISEIDGVNVLKVPSGSKIGHGVYTANQLAPLPTADLYDAKAVSLDEAKQKAKSYYDELAQNPVSSPAFNGESVTFGDNGWSHILGDREFDRKLSDENVKRRLKLLPKVKATLENTPFVDEVREKDGSSTKEYGILGRFADGDVIRVVVDEQNKNGKAFLSVYDWEDVSKKIKRNTLPESSLVNNIAGHGVGKAPSSNVNPSITPATNYVNSKNNKAGNDSRQGRIVPRGTIKGQ